MLMIGMSTAWPSPVLPMILSNTAPVVMDSTQISWMVSVMFLGNTLSPIPVGWLMDKFGRKRIMYILNLLPFSAWIITFFAESPWLLYLARFLNGLWAGTSYTACAVYIGEIADPSIRGSLSNFNNLLKSFGGLSVFVVGPYVSYKVLALVCFLVPTTFFLTAIFIPESPYFLVMKNRKEEARKALRWLRGNKEELALDLELEDIEKAVITQMESKGSIADIFTDHACRRAFYIAMILSFVKTISGFDVMMAYTSITLPKSAFESLTPNDCVIVLGIIAVIACIGSIFLLDRYPRRFLLTLSSIGCAVTTFFAGVWFFLNEKTEIDVQHFAQVPFYSFAIHAIFYSIGLGPIIANVKGELFSANIKSLCSALITIAFAVLNFFSTKLYLLIANSLGMYANYFIYFLGCALGTIFILTSVIETRGKTLREIQIELSERKSRSSS